MNIHENPYELHKPKEIIFKIDAKNHKHLYTFKYMYYQELV